MLLQFYYYSTDSLLFSAAFGYNDDDSSCWMCPKGCNRKYSNKGTLQRHLKYECGVPKKFKCHICGHLFARKEHFQNHVLCKHRSLLIQPEQCVIHFLFLLFILSFLLFHILLSKVPNVFLLSKYLFYGLYKSSRIVLTIVRLPFRQKID